MPAILLMQGRMSVPYVTAREARDDADQAGSGKSKKSMRSPSLD
jgi:hypothetical protein